MKVERAKMDWWVVEFNDGWFMQVMALNIQDAIAKAIRHNRFSDVGVKSCKKV